MPEASLPAPFGPHRPRVAELIECLPGEHDEPPRLCEVMAGARTAASSSFSICVARSALRRCSLGTERLVMIASYVSIPGER